LERKSGTIRFRPRHISRDDKQPSTLSTCRAPAKEHRCGLPKDRGQGVGSANGERRAAVEESDGMNVAADGVQACKRV